MEKNSSFTGNIERAIALSKFDEIAHLTASKPATIASHDGATLFKTEICMIVDTNFPTKAGNTTTALVIVPIDGAREFRVDGATLKMDGVPPFIYQGRGMGQIFTVLNDAGDVVKRHNNRKSAATEVAEMKKQLDAIMALLAKK